MSCPHLSRGLRHPALRLRHQAGRLHPPALRPQQTVRGPGFLPARFLTPALLTLLVLAGCEEKLPAYVAPDTPLDVVIIVDPALNSSDVSRLSPDFAVKITNTSDVIDSWVLPVPWSVSVDISISLARDPGRNTSVSTQRTFTNQIDDLINGYYVVIGFDLPLRDSEGRVWNWGHESAAALDIVLQGRVRIGQLDIRVNMPRVTTTLRYGSP